MSGHVSLKDSIDDASSMEWDEVMQSSYPKGSNNKYKRYVRGVGIDVYDVLKAWEVTNPALQHLIKKALQAGKRGHKDLMTDLQDIIDSAIRAKQLEVSLQ